MKKLYIILSLVFVAAISQAQRFEWAKGFETNGYEIIGGLTDSLGNLYILSYIDASSSWEGEALIPSPVKGISKDLTPQVLIAKISPEGEMVWRKIIVTNPTGSNAPQDIKKVGDSAFACLIRFTPPADGYTYYLDTLIIGASDYPIDVHYFKTFGMTLYLVLDFDGNVVEQHFLCITYTDADGNDICHYSMDTIPWRVGMFYEMPSFDLDGEGNIYISRRASDQYYDSEHNLCNIENGAIGGLKFWVDRRLAGEYRIEGSPKIWYPQLLKFSPHFDTLLACKYVVQKSVGETICSYSEEHSKLKMDHRGSIYYMVQMHPYNPLARNTIVIDSISDISVSHIDMNGTVSMLVKYDTFFNAKWVIAFEDDNVTPAVLCLQTGFLDFDFDFDSNLLFLYAATSRTYYRDTVNVYSIMTYQGVPLDLKSNTFFCAFDNNDTNPTIHSYSRLPEKYLSCPNVTGKSGNNRIIMQSQYGGGIRFPSQNINLNKYDDGFAMIMFDYSGRVIGGYDYGIVSQNVNHYAGPIIQHDSILYLCSLLRSNARFGDIDFYVTGSTNCIAKYVDTALMHPYVWNPAGIGAAQAVQPKVYPVPATDMLHFECPQGIATKVSAISVLGNKTSLPTKGNTADISSLAPGAYILEISNGKARYYSKFIKQ